MGFDAIFVSQLGSMLLPRLINDHIFINNKAVDKNKPQSKKSDLDWLSNKDFTSRGLSLSDHNHWEEKLGEHTYIALFNTNSIAFKWIEKIPFESPHDRFQRDQLRQPFQISYLCSLSYAIFLLSLREH